MPAVSIVIPMKNESGNVESVISEIAEHCTDVDYEVIVIDDASINRFCQMKQVGLGLLRASVLIVRIRPQNDGRRAWRILCDLGSCTTAPGIPDVA